MLILGIETSCDETGIAILNATSKRITLLSNTLASSTNLHIKTGGIIPETAARQQLLYIIPVIKETFKKAGLDFHKFEVDRIAVTYGPGLIGSLLVGVETARTLSYVFNKDIVPVNHLLGHVYANWINRDANEIRFPCIALVVSGGHTDLLLMRNFKNMKWLGGTRDDAAGECFDKSARLLGYSYPGGPKIAELAKKGNPKAILFPRPMLGDNNFELSFSGLKAAFIRETENHFSVFRTSEDRVGWNQISFEDLLKEGNKQTLYDLCASLQAAIVDVLVYKTIKAAEKYNAKSILLGGGVAANQALRDELAGNTKNKLPNTEVFVPQKYLCTDNGAMIAAAAFFRNTVAPWQKIEPVPSLHF